MATGGINYTEDSGYMSVRRSRDKNTDVDITSMEPTELLNSIKAMNKKLYIKVNTLEKEMNEQKIEFNSEKMTMVRNHKKETDSLKKRHEKTLDRLSDKSRESERQGEEIKRLKASIESLEKSEKELEDKLEKAKRKDCKYGNEYDQQTRELLASKEKIEILKQRIDTLKNKTAKIEKERDKANEQYDDLSSEIGNLAVKHEHHITALNNDLSNKIDDMKNDLSNKMEDMFQNFLRNQDPNPVSRNGPSVDQIKRQPLPSIARTQLRSSNTDPGKDSRPSWKEAF